jgi:hypothetical protein
MVLFQHRDIPGNVLCGSDDRGRGGSLPPCRLRPLPASGTEYGKYSRSAVFCADLNAPVTAASTVATPKSIASRNGRKSTCWRDLSGVIRICAKSAVCGVSGSDREGPLSWALSADDELLLQRRQANHRHRHLGLATDHASAPRGGSSSGHGWHRPLPDRCGSPLACTVRPRRRLRWQRVPETGPLTARQSVPETGPLTARQSVPQTTPCGAS